MQQLLKTYLPVLAHLVEVFSNPQTNAQRDWAKTTIRTMVKWKCRVTIAACVDILKMAWDTKVIFQKSLNICAVTNHVEKLKNGIKAYKAKLTALQTKV